MEVGTTKRVASHRVTLEGEDGLMATPPIFVRSRTCKGILPCPVSVRGGAMVGRLIEPLGANNSGVHQVDHGVKITHPGGVVLFMRKPKN
jgi:hypothetical protein